MTAEIEFPSIRHRFAKSVCFVSWRVSQYGSAASNHTNDSFLSIGPDETPRVVVVALLVMLRLFEKDRKWRTLVAKDALE